MTANTQTRMQFLGLRLCPMRAEELLAQIRASLERAERTVIVRHNLHSLYLLSGNKTQKS